MDFGNWPQIIREVDTSTGLAALGLLVLASILVRVASGTITKGAIVFTTIVVLGVVVGSGDHLDGRPKGPRTV